MSKAAGKALMDQLMPAIQLALVELGEEARLQELDELDRIEVDPVAFVAGMLRRRNPKRAERAVQKALAAAQRDKEAVGPVSDAAPPGLGLTRNLLLPQLTPEGLAAAGLTAAEATVIAKALAAGGVVSAGTRLPLLRRDGEDIEVLSIAMPSGMDAEYALRAELDATRGRTNCAMPPVMGSQPSLAAPLPAWTGSGRVPLGQLQDWLVGEKWSDYGLPGSLAVELRAAFVSNTPASADHLKAVACTDGGLSFGRFSVALEEVAAVAIAELAAGGADLVPAVLDLPPALLSSEPFRAALAATEGVTTLGVTEGVPLSARAEVGAAWRGLAVLCAAMPTLETLHLRGQRLQSGEATALFAALATIKLACLDMTATAHAAVPPFPPATSGGVAVDGAEVDPEAGPRVPDDVSAEVADAGAALALAMEPLLTAGSLLRLRAARCSLGDDGAVILFTAARRVPKRNQVHPSPCNNTLHVEYVFTYS